jgi:hypothetical protein
MGNTMLITVTGRRTGRKITLPVSYYPDGDTLWISSTRKRTWWRNVLPGASVGLHLHGRDLKGIADVVLDEAAVAARIGEYVHHLPLSAGPLGVRVQKGVANREDTLRIAKERVFVSVCISEAGS